MSPAPLRIGFIGCGNVVTNAHIPAVKRIHSLVPSAAADPVEANRARVLKELGLPESAGYESHREMLANHDLDYVVLATPPSIRMNIIQDCAEAGIHILSEKPVAVSPIEAQQQAKIMASSGCTFGFVHNYLYFPEYVTLRRLVSAGEIGAVRHITLNFLGVPDLPGSNHYQPGWRHLPTAAGGGVLMDMIHAVYLAEFLVADEIRSVSAVIENLSNPGDTVEDLALVHLYFEKAYATINMGWGHGPGGVEVTGAGGRIMVFYRDYRTGPFDQLENITMVNTSGRTELPFHDRYDGIKNFVAIHEDFANAVRSGAQPVAPARTAGRILEAALAAYTSALTGRVIDLPFPETHPVYQNGVAGLQSLPRRPNNPLSKRGLFHLEN